jgi:serine/threonine protein kinase
MPLSQGTRFGPYEVVAPLGAGGMGEVYRARDTKLGRSVALKVLPELFSTDPDRLARFTREAQVLASLNHPNIAAIYGLEGQALVMELVEGDDLSDVITRGPMTLADALPIARQIADAIEAAHEQFGPTAPSRCSTSDWRKRWTPGIRAPRTPAIRRRSRPTRPSWA